jgi:anti-sigma B factor antagonist
MGLELESHVDGTTARVTAQGDLDMATAPQLHQLFDRLIDAGADEIVVDCCGLEFLDSSGIGAIVAARTRLGDTGRLVLTEPRANVRKVLEVTGVDRQLEIRP